MHRRKAEGDVGGGGRVDGQARKVGAVHGGRAAHGAGHHSILSKHCQVVLAPAAGAGAAEAVAGGPVGPRPEDGLVEDVEADGARQPLLQLLHVARRRRWCRHRSAEWCSPPTDGSALRALGESSQKKGLGSLKMRVLWWRARRQPGTGGAAARPYPSVVVGGYRVRRRRRTFAKRPSVPVHRAPG